MDVDEKWYCVKEVSAVLSCSEDSIHRMVDAGEMKAILLVCHSPHRRRGYRSKRIAKSEIERYIKTHSA
jgi:hypothetical protein